MARDIVVHLSNGEKLTVSKEHEADLNDALTKHTGVVTLRHGSAKTLVNTAHIVRVEVRS